ncbi:hypothetical protein IGI37_000607 [Enterococcus sp. AZ194]
MKGMTCVARRGENIYKRKDGRWEGRYIKGRRLNHQIYYGYVYAKTFKDVRKKLAIKKREYQNQLVSPNLFTGTVSQWVNNWLVTELPFQVKASTFSSYRYKLNKYILPHLGEMPVRKVTRQTIQSLINLLLEEGLSVSTIRTAIQIFKQSFNRTNKENHGYHAIFQGLHYPFSLRKKIRALSKTDQHQLEKAAETSENGLPILLALHTGLRIGEISALKWADINMKEKKLTVTRTLQRIFRQGAGTKTEIREEFVKSSSSHRIIPLNKKILQCLILQKEKAKGDYVIGTNGQFIEPRTITYQFKKLLQSLNFRSLHFHQLRHTFATRLLELGADVASVSSLLGHQSVKMTLDIYVDSLIGQRKYWINKLA